jgi:hypothetical protein
MSSEAREDSTEYWSLYPKSSRVWWVEDDPKDNAEVLEGGCQSREL